MSTTTTDGRFDFEALRTKLATERGPTLWRSLEELADDEDFLGYLRAEFPGPAEMAGALAGVDRRSFLKLMGASLALAGLGACTRQPSERIFPYVDQPEQLVPGKPLFYATAFPLGATALGVLAESHLGRPTKLEGNELHPASLGATDVLAQASVLELYDPDRAQVITRGDEIVPWSSAHAALTEVMKRYGSNGGEGLRILTQAVGSPTLAAQLRALQKRYPKARWHRWEPLNADNVRRGSELAFEISVDTRYRLDNAEVIVALDSDFLGSGPAHVRYARDFSRRRRLVGEHTRMSRLYAVEATPSLTGAKADHLLAVAPETVELVALSLAGELGMQVRYDPPSEEIRKWTAALARDLQRVRGRSAVIAGETAAPVVHALAHWINGTLGNVAKTVEYFEPVEADSVLHSDSIVELASDMHQGKVSTLVVIGGNPVYDAPADLDFAGAMGKVEVVFRLGLYDDETSHASHWHIPQAHWLESWSDARAYDGTVTIQQPLIDPLYGGMSVHELVALMMGESGASAHEIVRRYWQSRRTADGFEAFWQTSLHDGVVADTAVRARRAELRWDLAARIENVRALQKPPAEQGIEGEAVAVVFRADPHVYDGRFANNPWLQELPKPCNKLVWDNAVLVAPRMAERLGVRNGDMLEIAANGRYVEGPAWIIPGQADGVVTLPLGYGRVHAGRIGSGRGFDAYRLRTVHSPWQMAGARVRKMGGHSELVSTQHHFSMEGRELVRSSSLEEYLDPSFAAEHEGTHEGASLYPEHEYESYAWGMTIDLNACIGCNACTIACQAENNIPIVGKEQVARGREMHWIRVDRYYEGTIDHPRVHHQPVPCMHCELAPCEVVCPVNATVHSEEGLNDMVYNRCVGTRYCSNNCPYKVRRFNFLLFNDFDSELPKLQRNPDVTVRSRGVMEKCTYCVQRISHARIDAKKEGRRIQDGEVVTACQQVCPVEAIVFGDINDPRARVTERKSDRRNYALLGELGTKPRTTYLSSVRNANPEIVALERGNAGVREPGGAPAPKDAGHSAAEPEG